MRGYYFLGAKNEEAETHNGSQKFLHWRIMLFLRQLNVSFYNMGGHRYQEEAGSKFATIQDFKLKFGAVVEEGLHFNLPLSPKYNLYQMLIKLKQRWR
jgi:lipid II:glycine glycyltransferase (peptidoglycan interpeptide bridge formation enzyme)